MAARRTAGASATDNGAVLPSAAHVIHDRQEDADKRAV
jgi:hypothetical protein